MTAKQDHYKTMSAKQIKAETIINNRLRRLYDRLMSIQQTQQHLDQAAEEIKNEVTQLMGVGVGQSFTVYQVGQTRVKGYTRSSYTAVCAHQ
jgi:hypothetical protein